MDCFIADSSSIQSEELREKLERTSRFQKIEIFTSKEKLLAQVLHHPPYVVFFNAGDTELNAFSAAKQIQKMSPMTRIVFGSDRMEYDYLSTRIGADFFMPFPADDNMLKKALSSIRDREPSGSMFKTAFHFS